MNPDANVFRTSPLALRAGGPTKRRRWSVRVSTACEAQLSFTSLQFRIVVTETRPGIVRTIRV